MNRQFKLAVFSFCGWVSACNFAPKYHRPDLPPPASFKEAGTEWKQASPSDSLPRGEWWRAFRDPQLDMLEARADAANQDLRAAFARYQQARAIARESAADFFPTVTAGASYLRNEQSQNKALYSVTEPRIYNDFLLNGDISYEIDVWGRVRNAVTVVNAQAQASAADFVSAQLSIEAELATDYVSLRTYDSEQVVLDETVNAYRKALELTQNRFRGGVASETDVDQAETQLQNALTQASDTRLKRAQMEHAIAVLIGQSASSFSLPVQALAITPVPLDPGLPSQLLERRPDVAASEREVAAANAQIGVARAAYFPVFSLTGMLGLESKRSSSWFEAPSSLWSFGPSAMLTVFDGGRREALNAEARAAYDESVANYRKTVLVAYQEVEDSLVAITRLTEEAGSQDKANAAAQRNLVQANNRYRGGLATYLEVATAQNLALQAQLGASDVMARRLSASVQLVKALGGGWTTAQLDSQLTMPIASNVSSTSETGNTQ